MSSHALETVRPAVPPYAGPLPSPHPSISKSNSMAGVAMFNNCDIAYGAPFPASCARQAEERFHAKRVFVIASASLARSTTALDELTAALGEKVAGTRVGLKAHTYFSDILSVAKECRALSVDLIVTLGGGSLTDAAKMVSLVLANNVTQPDELLKLATARTIETVPPGEPPKVPVVCIATTLSAAEFTYGAGVTDDRDNQKHQFLFPKAVHLVIFDAGLVAASTPRALFLQSGVRAIDHCVEPLCSSVGNEVSAMHAARGLAQLVPALLRCAADPRGTDVAARQMAQLATPDSNAAVMRVYTPCGGSHAIGHMLGPFGVGHGATSAILLPAVCAYNARHGTAADVERQRAVAAILWNIPEMRALAERNGLEEGSAALGALVDALFRALDMPRTLKEVGVGRDQFNKLAEYSLLDVWCATNPVPLMEKEQVMEILNMIAE
ncbi:putative Fe-containing alcohol dehydrogenase [Mycena pura]|uniref:Fe-containing alcohol dehydrogenase n=1 Tax=Mycena pura TaxID=153505 RepID=A0AAD6VG86_9AGAR|nr:putative Fe-containing alcohol dehydrogenase [Mycena pura]